MTLEVKLSDVLVASQLLTDLGTDYGSAVGEISAIGGDSAAIFETAAVSGPWTDVVNTIWTYLADSQDNCNDTGRTLVHYINSVCEEDSSHATELLEQVRDYNESLANTEQGQGDDLGDPLPEPDPSTPGEVVDPPDYDPAERPPGDN